LPGEEPPPTIELRRARQLSSTAGGIFSTPVSLRLVHRRRPRRPYQRYIHRRTRDSADGRPPSQRCDVTAMSFSNSASRSAVDCPRGSEPIGGEDQLSDVAVSQPKTFSSRRDAQVVRGRLRRSADHPAPPRCGTAAESRRASIARRPRFFATTDERLIAPHIAGRSGRWSASETLPQIEQNFTWSSRATASRASRSKIAGRTPSTARWKARRCELSDRSTEAGRVRGEVRDCALYRNVSLSEARQAEYGAAEPTKADRERTHSLLRELLARTVRNSGQDKRRSGPAAFPTSSGSTDFGSIAAKTSSPPCHTARTSRTPALR